LLLPWDIPVFRTRWDDESLGTAVVVVWLKLYWSTPNRTSTSMYIYFHEAATWDVELELSVITTVSFLELYLPSYDGIKCICIQFSACMWSLVASNFNFKLPGRIKIFNWERLVGTEIAFTSYPEMSTTSTTPSWLAPISKFLPT